MTPREFGRTGLLVSPLGLGAGHIGDPAQDEAQVQALLSGALESGVTLLDTARGYGLSEERIGRFLSGGAGRREQVVLSTKCGYGIPGQDDWTAGCIHAGVDEALSRLRTDRIDILHLHSCPREVLERGEVVEALAQAVRAGKVRVAAYSGENDALRWAVSSGAFGSVQCSVNPCDQRGLADGLPEAAARGLGVIAKRPLANAPWRFADRPAGHYAEVYWDRLRAMGLSDAELPFDELFLRFAAHAPFVSCCIVGTASLAHLRRAADLVSRGPLPAAMFDALRQTFQRHDDGWTGQV